VGTLQINDGAFGVLLDGGNLTVEGNATVGQSTSPGGAQLSTFTTTSGAIVGEGFLTIQGSLTNYGTVKADRSGSSTAGGLDLSGANGSGDIIIESSGTLDINQTNNSTSAPISIAGKLEINGGTVNHETSTLSVSGNLDNNSGTVNLNGADASVTALNNDGDFNMGGGTVSASSTGANGTNSSANLDLGVGGTLDMGDNFENGSSGTLDIRDGTLSLFGNFTNNGSFQKSPDALVEFDGPANDQIEQSLSGDFFDNNAFEDFTVRADADVNPADVLNESNASNDPVQIDGTLTVEGGATYGTGDADAGTVSEGSDLIYNGSTFSVTGDLFANNVTFDASTGTTTVSGAVFAEVTITDNTNVAVGTDDFDVVGLVSVNNGGSLDVSNTTLNLLGDFQVNGTLNASSGTVAFRGQGRETCCSGSSFAQDPTNRSPNNTQEVIGTSDIGFGTLFIDDFNTEGNDTDGNSTPETDVDFITSASDIEAEGEVIIDEAIASTARPFTVQGDFTVRNNADFTVTEDRLFTFTGGSGQELSTSSISGTFELPRVSVDKTSGTVNLSSPINITNLLEMKGGTLSPTSPLNIEGRVRLAGGTLDASSSTITLISEGATEAFVEYVDSNPADGTLDGTVTGDLTFQRQLDGIQNWYYMTAPEASGTNETFDAFLQVGGENDLRTRGVPGADDRTSDSRFASVRLYDESAPGSSNPSGEDIDEGWKAVSDLNNSMVSGKGYITYVYSDDDPNDATDEGFPKTIDSDVNPYTSTSFTYSNDNGSASDGPGIETTDNTSPDGIDGDEGWNLLSNPYFATIDFCAMNRGSDLSTTVQVWDPQNGTDGYVTDGYATYNCSGSNAGGAGDGLQNGYISPHQSFFVKATTLGDGSSDLSLSIDDITSVQANTSGFFQKSKQTSLPPAISLRFELDGMAYTASAAFVKGSQPGMERTDGRYFGGPKGESGLSFYNVLNDGSAVLTNSLPREVPSDTTLAFAIDGCDYGTPLSGEATITRSTFRNIPSGWGVVLKDTKENKQIDLSTTSQYTFDYTGSCPKSAATVSTNEGLVGPPTPSAVRHPVPKSGAPNTRFQLVVKPDAALPVEIASFTADTKDQAAVLNWATASEQNNAGFYVQRKTDGGSFATLDGSFVEGAGTSSETQEYSYRVPDLEAGTHTFRLKQVDTDGSASFSDPIDAKIGLDGKFKLTTYPNPVQSRATIEFAVKEASDVTIALYNTLGQKVQTVYSGAVPAEETIFERVDVGTLSSGLYFLRMKGDGVSATKRMTVVK
jgi:hypothetical protein